MSACNPIGPTRFVQLKLTYFDLTALFERSYISRGVVSYLEL